MFSCNLSYCMHFRASINTWRGTLALSQLSTSAKDEAFHVHPCSYHFLLFRSQYTYWQHPCELIWICFDAPLTFFNLLGHKCCNGTVERTNFYFLFTMKCSNIFQITAYFAEYPRCGGLDWCPHEGRWWHYQCSDASDQLPQFPGPISGQHIIDAGLLWLWLLVLCVMWYSVDSHSYALNVLL